MGTPAQRRTDIVNAPVGEFSLTRLERVISGPGKVEALGGELERRKLSRAVVVTGKTLGASALLARVTGALGARCAAVFTGARQHVPASAVRELLKEIERVNADCVVSFGGGSPIDASKAAIHSVLTGHAPGEPVPPGKAAGREIIHIAVPTTLSAGEYTSVGGITNETTLVKEGVGDPRIGPRTVINDPEMTLETPAWLWIATGMRALDHAVECAYSVRHHPLSDALATKAIALLVEHLRASIETNGADQLARRGYCQMAAWFSIFGATTTGFGLSHALGHQIGPRWNVPHGITSCITLPHAMRFMAGIAPDRFGPIAEGFGVAFDPANPTKGALECADRTAQFIAQFDVPHRLRDAGVPHEEASQIAGTVQHHLNNSKVVDRPLTREEIAAVLEASY
jgi:alcohol dehydrogenase class IV